MRKRSLYSLAISRVARKRAEALPYPVIDSASVARRELERGSALVALAPAGLVVRLLSGLISNKADSPPVVVVDARSGVVVPLLGAHLPFVDQERGAYYRGSVDLASEVAELLGLGVVMEPESDKSAAPAIDMLPGFVAEGDVARAQAMLNESHRVHVGPEGPWPPPLVLPVSEDPDLLISDRASVRGKLVTLRPPSLFVGVGHSSTAAPEDIAAAVEEVLASADFSPSSVAAVATVARRASGPVREVASLMGAEVLSFEPEVLSEIPVPNPSSWPLEAVGTSSVAEAAALAASGHGDLVVEKTVRRGVTVAVARIERPRGALSLVGTGPGSLDMMSARAISRVRSAAAVLGYEAYVEGIRTLIAPSQAVFPYPIGAEDERVDKAIELAEAGYRVALVCSGDPGVFGLAARLAKRGPRACSVEVVPGVTAALAASARAGGAFEGDIALISLSDIHQDASGIIARVRACASTGLAIAMYNPASSRRSAVLKRAAAELSGLLGPSHPLLVARRIERDGEELYWTTLGDLTSQAVDMNTCLIVPGQGRRAASGKGAGTTPTK